MGDQLRLLSPSRPRSPSRQNLDQLSTSACPEVCGMVLDTIERPTDDLGTLEAEIRGP